MSNVVPFLQAQLQKLIPNTFPRYEVITGGERKFLSLVEASRALLVPYVNDYDCVGKLVLEYDFTIRPMTDTEKLQLFALADALRTYGIRKSR